MLTATLIQEINKNKSASNEPIETWSNPYPDKEKSLTISKKEPWCYRHQKLYRYFTRFRKTGFPSQINDSLGNGRQQSEGYKEMSSILADQ